MLKVECFEKIESFLEKKILWDLYNISFGDDIICAQDQMCYDEDFFTKALDDPDYLKFILYQYNSPVGIALMTNNLVKARIAYCNDKFLINKYTEYAKDKKIYYITCLCVDKKHKGEVRYILFNMCKFIYLNQAIVVFDYSNNKNSSLPILIKRVANRISKINETTLDHQIFESMVFT